MTGSGLVYKVLKRAEAITLVIHQRPDGDALGSAAALFHYFANTKKIEIVCATEAPTIFERVTGKLAIKTKLGSPDVIILLDCAQWHRTGFESELSAAKKAGATLISFDHHERHNLSEHVTYSIHDASASSTTEILFGFLQELREPLSAKAAQCLLLGVFTDTACFRHPNTTSQTLKVASRLISSGANLDQLHSLFGGHRTLGKTKLWGHAFSTVRITKSGLAIVTILTSLLQETGATLADVAGLANNLALLHEARGAAVMVQTPTGWKATLRTRHADVDLRRLAKYFEGRGMQKATGFFATNDLVSGKISSV